MLKDKAKSANYFTEKLKSENISIDNMSIDNYRSYVIGLFVERNLQ